MRLRVENFRNLAPMSVEFDKTNYLFGANGAGKTSILESLFLLSFLRSFRQVKNLDEAICYGQKFFLLQMEWEGKRLTLEKIRSQPLKLQVDGVSVRMREFLLHTPPTKVLSPHIDFFFNIEADYRRRFMDWLVFHVKQDFYSYWSKYEVVLENRNAGLKNKHLADDDFWIDQLALWGARVTVLREDVFLPWRGTVLSLLSETSLRGKVDISLYKGWAGGSIQDALKQSRQRDIEKGATDAGAHRSDVEITHQGTRVASVFSRGQLKLLNLAMVFAQMEQMRNYNPILLIDDLGAELDGESLYFFKQWLMNYHGNLFVSVIDRSTIDQFLPQMLESDRLLGRFFLVNSGIVSVINS